MMTYLSWRISSAHLPGPGPIPNWRRQTGIKQMIHLSASVLRLPHRLGRGSGHAWPPVKSLRESIRERASVSTRCCSNHNLKLTNEDNSPADGENNCEKVNSVGNPLPTLPTLNKQKLNQLNQPNNIDYSSNDSAKDDTKGLRPQKQQKKTQP